MGSGGEGEERSPDFCDYTARVPRTVGGWGVVVFLVYMLNGTKVEGRGSFDGEWGAPDFIFIFVCIEVCEFLCGDLVNGLWCL